MSKYEFYSLIISSIYDIITLFLLFVAIFQYNRFKNNERMKSTFEFVERAFWRSDFASHEEAHKMREYLHNADKFELEALAENRNLNPEMFYIILNALNKYEHIAVATSHYNDGFMDYRTFYELYATSSIIMWDRCYLFIQGVRRSGAGDGFLKYYEGLVARLKFDKNSMQESL